jgi:glycosyltransferase involved in cell wall biosynthesis
MQSVSSVLNQTTRDFEIIICDDNSSDPDVLRILEIFSENDSHIRVVNSNVEEKNRYVAARYAVMINHAINHMAEGEYISYLPDDDVYYPDKLERGIKLFEDNPDYKAIYFNQNVVDIDLRISGQRQFDDQPMEKAANAVDHVSIMHTKQLFFDVGGWPTTQSLWGGADAGFMRKVQNHGVAFMPVGGHPGDAHRYHEDSVQWKIANKCFYPE